MTLRTRLVAGVSTLAILFGAAIGVAGAQETAPAPQTETPAAAPTPSLDEGKLKSFAVAFLEVTKVTRSYQPQIEAAGTVEDQQRLQQEAGARMVEAVNGAEGITVDEYNMIIQAAQTDPELAQQINTHITAAASSDPAAAGAPSEAPPAAE